jgi:CRP/FNR family cyclic AMP-dependent transcriptional regulator
MDWPLLASLGDTEREAVLGAARRRAFSRGEVVMHEGDPADSLHLVTAGHFAVRASTPDGDTVTLNVLSTGSHFGELSLLDTDHGPSQRSATVQALDPASTLSISASLFRRLCADHPDVERLLILALAERVRELSARLLEAQYVGLDRRLYRRLLELHDLYDGEPIPLTQEQLADLVGGTRPSVNQVLQRLVSQQIVELARGRLSIKNHAALTSKASL